MPSAACACRRRGMFRRSRQAAPMAAKPVGEGPMSGVGDSFTERTRTSWFSRIGKSIVAVLFGLVLLVGSSVLLFWNEGRAVQTERSLAEGRGLVVTVEPARVDPANEGKLVHVNGEVKAVAPLRDPEFRVAVTALRLIRTVEMYQWKEEKHTDRHTTLGGSEDSTTTYTYHLTRNGSRIDSSHFRRPDGNDNPQMRYTRTTYTARDATPVSYTHLTLPTNREV